MSRGDRASVGTGQGRGRGLAREGAHLARRPPLTGGRHRLSGGPSGPAGSSSTSWPSYSTKLVFWFIPRYGSSLATTCACGATRTLSECGELGMRIFMQGLVGCSMSEGVCARAYIQRRALTASRRSMDTSISTRSLSARLRRGRSRTRRRRYRSSRRSRSRRLLDDGAAPRGEDVDQRHSADPLFNQRSVSSKEWPGGRS